MQSPSLCILAVLATGLASCSEEQTEYSHTQRRCIAQKYSNYDPKDLSQCVDVCNACLNGTMVTCNASCNFKGAT